jgi:hypothetical protein
MAKKETKRGKRYIRYSICFKEKREQTVKNIIGRVDVIPTGVRKADIIGKRILSDRCKKRFWIRSKRVK